MLPLVLVWTAWFGLVAQAEDTAWQAIEDQIIYDPQAALQALSKVEKDHEPARVLFLRSQALLKMGLAKQAIGAAREAVGLDAGVSRYHTQYAKALLRRISSETMFAMTNTGRFLKALDKAIELDPKDPEPRLYKTLFLLNAPAIAGGSRAKAEAEAAKLAEVSEAYGLLAQLQFLRADKKSAEAQPLHERLVSLDPDNIAFAFGYAQYLRRAEQIDAALAFTENKLAAHPDAMRLVFARAVAQIHGERDLAAGIAGLQRYLRDQKPFAVGPPPANAWYWIGVAHQKAGQTKEAREAFEKTLAENPKHRAAAKRLAELNG
ncbi:Tetratricopeptide repeat protein [Acanthopleuribacter pedis]